MSHIIDPFRFARETDNLTGTPHLTLPGTNFTAGANSVDGTAVTLLSALAHDVHFLVIGVSGVVLSTADAQALADLLVDPAGGTSWAPLITDLICGFTPVTTNAIGFGTLYSFPIFIRAGSSVGFRCNTLHTVDITTGRTVIWAYGEPSRPDSWWCGQKVESIGIVGGSKGTDHTPGASGAFSTFASVGSPTTGRYGALQLGLNGSDNNSSSHSYYWQMGIGSAQIPGTPTMYSAIGAAEQCARVGFGMPIFTDIPSGTQLQVRATADAASPEVHNVGYYGVI